MYFSRITIKPDAVKSKEFFDLATGPYQIHSMIWELFSESEDQKRDFLYRMDIKNSRPVIYTVSQREPNYLGNLWNIETKPYNPQISEGMSLGFTLRANPVVKKTVPSNKGMKGKQSRHDVVMDAKWRIREKSGKDAGAVNMSKLIQQEGFRWLANRSDRCGFSIDPKNDFEEDSDEESRKVRVDAYTQHKFIQGAKKRAISLSTLDYTGVLTVTDKGKFTEALYHGIGPAKGFGCGLMMIRRI